MNLLGRTKSKITMDKIRENVPHSEITDIVLVHFNIVNNDYQCDSRDFYTCIPNELFGQLLDLFTKKFLLLKTFNSKFSYFEIWFTGQNSKPLETEDKINITLIID